MIGFITKLAKDRRGNVLVIVGAALPMLVGAAGLATDTIQWAMWKRQLQRAADSGAIAGVYDRNSTGTTDGTEAAVLHDLDLNNHTGISWVADPAVTFPADSGDMRNQVNLVLQVRKELPFSSMFMTAAPIIQATARAASVPGADEYCVVSLETRANKVGITIGGSSSIEMDCGMISNSPATNSALANGNASKVKASVIAAVGGVLASKNWNVPKYDPYVEAVTDPYGSVNPSQSDVAGCDANPAAFTETTVVAAGTTSVCVSSLSIGSTKTNANMSNGQPLHDVTIYITGKNANTAGNAVIQGTFNCTTCTIVLTNKDITNTTAKIGTFDMNAGAKMTITAPSDTTNKYHGIAVFQDRRATDTNGAGSPNKFNGGGAQTITGALYFPSQEISYSGDGSATAVCTRFVARRVVFTGNNATTNLFQKGSLCPIFGNNGIGGGRRVRLVA